MWDLSVHTECDNVVQCDTITANESEHMLYSQKPTKKMDLEQKSVAFLHYVWLGYGVILCC